MNIAAVLMLVFIGLAAAACLCSDWTEFDEDHSEDDDSDNPYDGQNGI